MFKKIIVIISMLVTFSALADEFTTCQDFVQATEAKNEEYVTKLLFDGIESIATNFAEDRLYKYHLLTVAPGMKNYTGLNLLIDACEKDKMLSFNERLQMVLTILQEHNPDPDLK